MSYEFFRTDVLTNFSTVLPQDMMSPAINAVDRAAADYDFSKKPVSLIVINDTPEPMKLYLAAKATENFSKDTLKGYFYCLRSFFSVVRKQIDQITTNDIRCYLFDYQQRSGISNRTLEQHRICINGFFDWCVRDRILLYNPCASVQHIKYYSTPRDPMSITELEYIRMACRDSR